MNANEAIIDKGIVHPVAISSDYLHTVPSFITVMLDISLLV